MCRKYAAIRKKIRFVSIIMILVVFITACSYKNEYLNTSINTSNNTQVLIQTKGSNTKEAQVTKIEKRDSDRTSITESSDNKAIELSKPISPDALGNATDYYNIEGIAASDGTYTYYWYGCDDTADGYLMRSKTESDYKVLSEDRPKYINIVGDWIYYLKVTNHSQSLGQIYRIKKDGTGRTLLYSEECTDMSVVEDRIYFIKGTDTTVNSINLDGTELKKYDIAKCASFCYSNGWYIYTTKSSTGLFISKEPSQKNAKKILNFNGLYLVYKNKIFYTNNNQLYRMDINGQNKKQIFNKQVDNFNISNDEIFCFIPYTRDTDVYDENGNVYKEEQDHYMYKLNLDGKKITKISMGYFDVTRFSISSIIGNDVYYFANYGEGVKELRKVKKDGSGDSGLVGPFD